jgi:hypothetical protein
MRRLPRESRGVVLDLYRKSISNYCSICGLQYRKWACDVHKPACEDCEPEKYLKLRETNITSIKKRTIGQQHITEHTWFPKKSKEKK